MTDSLATVARAGVVFARVVQLVLVGLAVVLLSGAFLGNFSILAFSAVALFVLILLAFVGVVEFVAIRPAQRRWSA